MKEIKKARLVAGALFAALGLFFVIFGLLYWSECNEYKTEGVSVQAVCTRKTHGDLWFSFRAEGKEWEVKSTFNSASIHVGEELTVYYMAGNPKGARLIEWWTYGIFMIMGGIYTLMGVGILIWQWVISARIASLQAGGQRVWAQVTQIKRMHHLKMYGRSPYVLYAVCTHPYTGNEITVKSSLLMSDPSLRLTDGKVEVLVDMMNEKRYHVLADDAPIKSSGGISIGT